MNVLLSYTSNPRTTASYIEKAMRRICGVITYGPSISRRLVKEGVKNHQISFTDGDMGYVLKRLPSGWTPDVFLFIDTGFFYPLTDMNSLKCVKACYIIDAHREVDRRIEFAKKFDVVFTAYKPAVAEYKERGITNVFWMPVACDQEIHGKKTEEKLYDIGFVGKLNPAFNPERVHLYNELKQRFNVYYERCFLEKMAEVFSQSKIVFNKSIECGLNMRVFEVLASGSMLLTNEAKGSGLADLFKDRKHMVIYRNEKELLELADYYLKNADEREKIAAEGMEKVLSEHTYSHRVNEMVKIISTFMG